MYIYGVNPIKDIFKKKKEIILEIYIDKKRHQNFFKELQKKDIKIFDISEINYQKIFQKQKVQGIVAKIKDPFFFNLKDWLNKNKGKEGKRIIFLDRIEDPQNFGAIIRNVASFNGDAIIFSDYKNAPFNATVIKASAGTWINVDLINEKSLSNSLEILKKNGFWIVSTTLEGDKDINFLKKFSKNNLAIILGNEGSGVRKSFQEKSDIKLKINISKNVDSLNVSVTSALVLFSIFDESKNNNTK